MAPTSARKLILTGFRQDGTDELLTSRTLGENERVDLRAEARQMLDLRVETDRKNARRMLRTYQPPTVAVRADLKVGGTLVNRETAHC